MKYSATADNIWRFGDATPGGMPWARRARNDVLVHADGGAALEGEARACYLGLDFLAALAAWERAYAAYRAEGDPVGAVRMARTLAGMHGQIRSDAAVMSGWLARGRRCS